MNRSFTISLFLIVINIFISSSVSAQSFLDYKAYPPTRLIFNDGSVKCGYYDETNNRLFDCTGNVDLNTPANIIQKTPDIDCCNTKNDRDGDGVNDEEDKCPDVKGPANNFGCPEIPLIVMEKVHSCWPSRVYFEQGTFKILPNSQPILKQLVQILKDHPDYRVTVEGHTDSVGDYNKNVKLSADRAAFVANLVIAAGIDKGRVKSVGRGPDWPVVTNKTKTGRAINRRVELKITL